MSVLFNSLRSLYQSPQYCTNSSLSSTIVHCNIRETRKLSSARNELKVGERDKCISVSLRFPIYLLVIGRAKDENEVGRVFDLSLDFYRDFRDRKFVTDHYEASSFFQIGVTSSTAWLESNLNWHGILILTEPKSFFEAQRSTRNPQSKVLHACLSTDTDTKEVRQIEIVLFFGNLLGKRDDKSNACVSRARTILQIKYHQESEVQVTKLGDGPNSLVSDDGFPTTRLKCFPLYSVLLAYNVTTLDYLSLDSPDAPDGQVNNFSFIIFFLIKSFMTYIYLFICICIFVCRNNI